MPKADRLEPDRADGWTIFELTEAVAAPIQSYSHGMRQKIVLIAALLPDPRVMVLDEPMVGLDARSAHHLKEMMRTHCDRGGTLFFSTHIMEVAEKLCDRIGIIHKGRLIACGTLDELQARRPGGPIAGKDLPGADRAMKKLLRLVRVGLRVNFGLSLLRPRHLLENKRDLWLVPLIGLGIAGPGSRPLLLSQGIRFVYGLLTPMGQQGALLTFGLLAGQFLILVFGFYYVLSAFYFSRDLDLLVSLPVAPAQVLLSKFAVIVRQRVPDGRRRSSCRCSSRTASMAGPGLVLLGHGRPRLSPPARSSPWPSSPCSSWS